ncbi:MAG: LytTR family transcriptional regulator [Clostridiales bacterium]|nr:LytTR family transcriptional regulator [Clostridiales bacterium]
MKIKIEEDIKAEDLEITIRCRQTSDTVIRILEMLRMTDRKLTGHRENQTYILDVSQILYIDTVEKRTFLYTEEGVYETPLKLYELAERLESCDFFRASKSSIINFNQIQSLKPEFGGTMQVTMTNGERLNVSRQYARAIKEKLGCL